jgi:hypothetical protein
LAIGTRRHLYSNRNLVTLLLSHVLTHTVNLHRVVYRQGKEVTVKRTEKRKADLGPLEGTQKRKRDRGFVKVSVNSCQQ